MAAISHFQTLAEVVRWIARVWGTLVLAFVLFFLLADILAPGAGAGFADTRDALTSVCFPLGTLVGLAAAWKWPGWGGLIATTAMLGLLVLRFDLIGSPIFVAMIAPPGIIHLLSWFLSRMRARAPFEAAPVPTRVKWIGAAAGAAVIFAIVIVVSPPRSNPYSLTSEVAPSFTGRVERVQVTVDVDPVLRPVFSNSFEHSLAAALESNGIDATIKPNPERGASIEDSAGTTTGVPDVAMQIRIDPLLRTREDGAETIVGTIFDVSVRDTTSANALWHAAGKVDYIVMFGPRYEAGADIKREFAFNTTAAIVNHFVAEVNGDQPAPIYTSLEGRRRHGQRAD